MSSSKKRITVKVDNSYVIWFEESNRWMQFEEPAYFIYKLFCKDIGISEIYSRCQKRYNLPELEIHQFANSIIARINESLQPSDDKDYVLFDNNRLNSYSFHAQNIHSYLINQKRISLEFENDLLGYYIHPLLSHLEIKVSQKLHVSFEIFTLNGRFILRYKGIPEFTWIFAEINSLKRKLFIEISNTIYHKNEESWMSSVHASAVTDMNQTVLLSSSSGYGKSTMAALLLKHGLELVSDDFALLEAKSCKAYPFPAAISLKDTSFDLFSSEKLMTLNYHGLKNRSVKYLVPDIKDKCWYAPHPVRKLVFVKYNRDGRSEFSKLTVLSALKLFYEQAKVSASYENARKFINWFIKVECYKLEHSDNQWAIKKILDLFEN